MVYDQNYWDNKWPKAPIIYEGRVLKTGTSTIGIDVKDFITVNDVMLEEVVRRYNLKKGTLNETAWAVQKWVCNFLTYKYDDDANKCPEFWQFPFETLQSEVGDCEDGAILIAALGTVAEIPNWKIKVAAGYVQESPSAPEGGHAYCIYLADRKETERKLEWVILDWCYFADPKNSPEKKPLARDGGYNNCYKETWFTFNNEFSWNQQSLKIEQGRISNQQTTQMNEVVAQTNYLDKVMASIAKKVRDA